MGSLSSARAVLAHLQRRELQLLQELSDVRKSLAAQKVVLDELVKASAVPFIDRLPNELLAEIFLLCRDDRKKLLMVSRRWRAVIFDISRMWTEIDMLLDSLTMRKLCLERSREAPLTLNIIYFIPEPDFFLPHANRWHTLTVFRGITKGTLSMISQIILPSLRYLVLDGAGSSLYDVPTMRSWAPSLKHLQLVDCVPPLPRNRPLCQFVPESLEELLITSSHDWNFEKDSMHFPSLQRLTLGMGDPIPFLEAIVAPKLASFSFTPDDKESTSETFTGTKMKFNNVSHLDLRHKCEVDERNFRLFLLLCRLFCGIRHADIDVAYVPLLFPNPGQGVFDHCTSIESLNIRGIILGSFQPLRDLACGFEKRVNLGQRKLHLKLTGNRFMDEVLTLNTSDTFFQRLQKYCASVVLDGIPVSPQLYLPTQGGSLLSTYSVVNV